MMDRQTEFTPGPWESDGCKGDGGHRYYQIDASNSPLKHNTFPYTVADTLNRHHCVKVK